MMKNFSKKILYLFIVCLFSSHAQAQVDNYCLRLTENSSVNCGEMPELDGKTAYTIQFWMKAGTWKSNAPILSRGSSLLVRTAASQAISIVTKNNTLSVRNAALAEGKWAQVTMIYNGKEMIIFINGTRATSKKGDFTIVEDYEPFTIGGGFDGYIDELRVWNAELRDEYDYFVHNTLNKWVPQLDNLVAYYKFDQNLCPNIVDYKPLFVPKMTNNHHGIISGNARRQKVTDNTGLPYLLNGGYIDDKRFFDSPLPRDLFLLANDIIVLGVDMYQDGHVRPTVENDHATPSSSTQILTEYQGRNGVLSLIGTKNSRMECPTSVISNGSNSYTFEAWIYLEKWTEGAYIFRRETEDKQSGFSISLGDEETKEIVVRVNGKRFVNTGAMSVGKWVHLGVTPNSSSSSTARAFLFAFNGSAKWVNESVSDSGRDIRPSGMDNCKAYIGENLSAKLDNITFWSRTNSASEMRSHSNGDIPFASLDSRINIWSHGGIALYTFDRAGKPGHDSFSQDELRYIVDDAYKGYRGYQVRLAVMGFDWEGSGQTWSWKTVIADPAKRKIFAEDLAQISKNYDGVELDLEWMDGLQTNLGLLADEILKALPKGKSLMISHHQYGAYQYPKEKIASIDGFTFQQYGNQEGWFRYSNFVNGYNAFKNYGYPDDKIYLSYSTTTSFGYKSNGEQTDIAGVGWGLMEGNYKPATDGEPESSKFNGYTYYFTGPVQVYNRAKFCVEKNVKGIFYWDMANDVHPAHKYSLSKACNYALSSNVDTLVTEVQVNHVTAIKQVNSDTAEELQIRYNPSEQTFSVARQAEDVVGMEIFTTTGVKVRSEKQASISTAQLPTGVYLVKVRLRNGREISRSLVKR